MEQCAFQLPRRAKPRGEEKPRDVIRRAGGPAALFKHTNFRNTVDTAASAAHGIPVGKSQRLRGGKKHVRAVLQPPPTPTPTRPAPRRVGMKKTRRAFRISPLRSAPPATRRAELFFQSRFRPTRSFAFSRSLRRIVARLRWEIHTLSSLFHVKY